MTIQTLKNDILAGITVAIVALPLALAFGVVSGAGAIAGLYGAIILCAQQSLDEWMTNNNVDTNP